MAASGTGCLCNELRLLLRQVTNSERLVSSTGIRVASISEIACNLTTKRNAIRRVLRTLYAALLGSSVRIGHAHRSRFPHTQKHFCVCDSGADRNPLAHFN